MISAASPHDPLKLSVKYSMMITMSEANMGKFDAKPVYLYDDISGCFRAITANDLAGGAINAISQLNSTSTPLSASGIFSGIAEDVSLYDSLVIAAKTDQDGQYAVQFSNDSTNWDSTLNRYYRTNQVEAPHRFTITRKYARVIFTNTSTGDQSYLRLQTAFGDKSDLNAPLDSVLAQDFDAVAVRPTDYRTEVALGRRQGTTLWNKFGYNPDIDIASGEVIAAFGGTFFPMTTARTLSIVSTNTGDSSSPVGAGANSVIIYGIDGDRKTQNVQIPLSGTTPVVTSQSWLGVNRMAVTLAGAARVNLGTITATATTDNTIQALIPSGEGTTQQCIFFTQDGHQALAEWLTMNVIRFGGGGTEPVVTLKGWVYSAVSNAKYEVIRVILDTAINDHEELAPPLPFAIGEKSCFWLEASTTRDNTVVNARFSLIESRDVDT